jgi:protein-tyrosine phosphatase
MKKLIFLFIFIFIAGCAPEYIAHVDGNLWRSSRQSDFTKFEPFTKVINLEEDNPYVEAEKLTIGVKQVHIPLSDTSAPTKAQLLQILNEITISNGPVVVHCWRGKDRTGYAIMTYRILINHWSVDQAYEEAIKYGHSNWIYRGWKPVLYELK